jgi:aspartyl-tRNA(Asn)/glutamyl-tRNA(Gln) amidotransferase subunit B
MGEWEPVIGLEIHVQLSTRTKMFCGCELSFGDDPNVHTCPICLAHPGSLPVPNERAIDYAIRIGLALGCEIAPRSIFHRKNYFYPDNPKAYQISQFDYPLCTGGRLGDVRIHRVHLEEDAAKLVHESATGRIHDSGVSLVDFNRGGTPLVEIVTEPDLHEAAAARGWLQLLRTTIRQLGVSDVNMEEGSLRADANVSLRPAGSDELGTKTELKNMNSFRFLERGVEAEIARQAEILDAGGKVEQETLHFDPRTGGLTPLRSKEYSHDYRYFPEPDLVPLAPTEEMIAAAREALPELPAERRERYATELGLGEKPATQLAFDAELGAYFERALNAARQQGDADPGASGREVEEPTGGVPAPTIANWVTGELVARIREAGGDDSDLAGSKVSPEALAKLAGMVAGKQLTTGAGRQVLAAMVAEGGDPAAIAAREGLGAIADPGELEAIVERAIEADAAAADRVRQGNARAIGPLVGFVMRETHGRADGGEVTRLIHAKLGIG